MQTTGTVAPCLQALSTILAHFSVSPTRARTPRHLLALLSARRLMETTSIALHLHGIDIRVFLWSPLHLVPSNAGSNKTGESDRVKISHTSLPLSCFWRHCVTILCDVFVRVLCACPGKEMQPQIALNDCRKVTIIMAVVSGEGRKERVWEPKRMRPCCHGSCKSHYTEITFWWAAMHKWIYI